MFGEARGAMAESAVDAQAVAPDAPATLARSIGLAALAALAVAVVAGVAPFASALTIGVLVPAAIIDVHVRRLPDAWVVGAATALIMSLAVTAAVGGDIDVLGAAVGAVAMSAPVAAMHLVSPAAMGFGDVKASLVLGAALGVVDWRLGIVSLCLAGFGGAAFGLATRRRTIAFGPWLVGSALVSLVANEPIIEWLFTSGGAR